MLGRNVVTTLLPLQRFRLFGVSKTQTLALDGIKEFKIDLVDFESVHALLEEVAPEIIIHTAAFTNLNYCEGHKIETHDLHVKLTKILAEFPNVKLIYISTDSVFDGTNGNYDENFPTYPLNYYAHSKLEGEWAALSANPRTLVIRTNIFGLKNPIGNSLAEWALKSFKEEKTINGFNDVMFNPLYVGQLSELLIKLIDTDLAGIIHVGASENMSKFEFLKALARTFGFPQTLVSESVSPVDSSLKRPRDTTLNIDYLKKVLNIQPSISTGLEMFKANYLKLV